MFDLIQVNDDSTTNVMFTGDVVKCFKYATRLENNCAWYYSYDQENGPEWHGRIEDLTCWVIRAH